MRRRRDTDYHRYGPGNAAPREDWPAYPTASPGPRDPLAATRDARLTGPAAPAPPPPTRPTDAQPLRPSEPTPRRRAGRTAPPLGTPGPVRFWSTARGTVVPGAVAGAIYLGICTALGLTADDAAIFLPAGGGFMLLGPITVLVVAAWGVHRVRARDTLQAPSRALRGWTRAYGVLLGFLAATFVWAGLSG